MKKVPKSLLAVLVFVLFTLGAAISGEISVRVPMDGYPPFFKKTETGQWTGLSIDLAEALLTEAGYRAVYTPLPFRRALKHLENGSLDMMLNLTITDERAAYINFIGPQLDETVVLVVPKNADFSIESLEDIKKLSQPIGVEIGKVYGETFERKRASDKAFADKFTAVRQVESMEKMLASGHTSGFLGYGYYIFHRFNTNPDYKNFKVHPFIFRQDWVHFGFSKASVSRDTLKQLEGAYQRLEQSGTLAEIRKRYTTH
jgi:ABC-type amino acid transport substrate-binding protein